MKKLVKMSMIIPLVFVVSVWVRKNGGGVAKIIEKQPEKELSEERDEDF